MKIKRYIKNILQVTLITCILFQICTYNIINVFANDISDIEDFPRKRSVVYNGKISYGDNIVGDFTIDGRQAFCMEHPTPTPPTGTKIDEKIYDNSNIRKVLYYGWQGAEQWNGFKSRAHGIVVTSLALSYYYYGDNSSPKTIEEFMNYIKNKTVPNFSVTFSKSKVSAYKEGNIQRTETITLNSGSNLFGIDISLLDNMTYVDETHGKRQTGGSVTIKGQTMFHFEAPLNVKLSEWESGNKTSSFAFQPIASIPSAGYQPLGSREYIRDPSKTTSLTVDWLQLGSIEITKNDIYGNLINGAVFRLWNDDGYDNNVTVTNGKIKIENLVTGNYFLQEQTAPNGFLVDKTIYTINLNASDDIKQIVSNKEPRGTITVTKKDNYGNKVGNTKFYVKANGDIRSAGGNLLYPNGTTVDTLVTNANGVDTTVELPIGNYVVEEYEVPYGYLLNKNKFNVSLKYANQDTPLVTTSTSVVNDEPKGTITVTKTNNLSDKVANAKFHTDLSDEELLQTINHYLPEDIEVTSLARMPERFHSRLNAVDKTYEYRIVIDGRKHVFERKYVYFPEAPLDVEKMKEASKAFIGTYDFRSFCANKRMKKSTVRTITGIDFCEKDGILTISYTGTGFLYHMVRILTGTLVEAGMGKRDIVSMTELLKAKNRESAGFLAPACGLLLKEVRYE